MKLRSSGSSLWSMRSCAASPAVTWGTSATGHTLQPTALVNEAYLRLIDIRQVQWQDRAHFFAMSSRVMRRILVDVARARGYQKRGGGARQSLARRGSRWRPEPAADVVALDDALTTLAAVDARKSQVVEMRYFGGLSIEETAEALGVVGTNGEARLDDGEAVAVARAQEEATESARLGIGDR